MPDIRVAANSELYERGVEENSVPSTAHAGTDH